MVKSVIQVDAPRTRVFTILTDYPRYQEWVAGCTSSTVTTKTDTTAEADIVISGMKRMTLGLRFETFPEQTINFRMVRGTDVKAYSGSYRLMDSADGKGTVVVAELQVDVGGMAPKFMVDRIVSKTFDDTATALKAYVQKTRSSSEAAPARDTAAQPKRKSVRRLLKVVKTGDGYRMWILGESFSAKPMK
jgi:carbon monoxide dehydrogenase subunit G